MTSHFESIINSPGPGNPFTYVVRDRQTGRWIGGVGANEFRPWVFPLYTPSGLTVIQEYPYDHPWHNGIFVAQHPVSVGTRSVNFWATPPQSPRAEDASWSKIGRMAVTAPPLEEIQPDGYRFIFTSEWYDENEQPVLQEMRSIRFHMYDQAHAVDVTSVKIAAYGTLEFPQTKHGCIGARVEPRLLPALGGAIIADGGRRGAAALVDANRQSDFAAYENTLVGHTFGLCLHILDAGVRGPWFIRDYGMAWYNATWERGISVPAGESWTVSLRVVAYDGALTPERFSEWKK